MGADSLAENTSNALEFIWPICLPKPKTSGFQWKKASLGVRSPWLEAINAQWSQKIIFSYFSKIGKKTIVGRIEMITNLLQTYEDIV